MSVSVRSLGLYHVRIPLRKPIRHALATRTESDNLVVEAVLSDGTVGFGEGVPRSYVTGETIDGVWSRVGGVDWGTLQREFASYEQVVAFCDQTDLVTPNDARACNANAARCAVELALLDAFGRHFGRPLWSVVPLVPGGSTVYEPQRRVQYSGAVTADTPGREVVAALKMRLWGFRHCKVKVGVAGQDDARKLRTLRTILGRRMDVRADANGGWTPDQAIDRINRLAGFGLSSMEQPIDHQQCESLARVRQATRVPIMLDESLCSMRDARRAIENGWCDLFNIRLSKCGGMVRSVALAVEAVRHGLGYQLGCQVGETGILSAAGRHFAAAVADIRCREGSYDRHLVRRNLLLHDITFGYAGWAPRLDGAGLGVTVDREQLDASTQRKREIDLG